MKFNSTEHFYVIFVTCILLVGTLFVPTTVYTSSQERSIELGYPSRFVVQNSSYDFIETYQTPYTYSLKSPWEHTTRIIWGKFFLSFIIIFSFLEAFLYVLYKLKK